MVSAHEYTDFDQERWVHEDKKSLHRTPFERDRARLIHSSALRRLSIKTQVLEAGTDDFVRNRLTHTLEVAQIGRQLARLLGANPDLVDCACLAHDIGHPPFGHTGEAELAKMASHIGGFEGNAQTLRILTRLEPKVMFAGVERSAGLNLTRAALEASMKYPWNLDQAAQHPKGSRGSKFGYYPDDEPVFRWIRKESKEWTTPIECQMMDLADDIAYSVHDLEDGIVFGAIELVKLHDSDVIDAIIADTRDWYGERWDADKLLQAYQRLQVAKLIPESFNGSRQSYAQLKNITSALIGRFVTEVDRATRDEYGMQPLIRYRGQLIIPEEISYEIAFLKGISTHCVMIPRDAKGISNQQQQCIHELVEMYMNFSQAERQLYLDPIFWHDWQCATTADEQLRVIVDQVSYFSDHLAETMNKSMKERYFSR